MFIKYDKTYHVLPYQRTNHITKMPHKKTLDKTQLKRLLSGRVVVEEKMDGANVGIVRHHKGFSLQKRGSLVGSSEHPQFQRFHAWANNEAYERIMSLPEGVLLYGEWLYAVHHIYYDRLPEYFLVFDIRRGKRWFDRSDREEFCEEYGFHQVPLIAEGHFTKEDLLNLVPNKSQYGDTAEGIVVKRYAKHGYFRGKIVRPDFLNELAEVDHWSGKPLRFNQLAGWQ